MAFGSRSKLNSEPKGKCWTTGNLERTSALYIFIMPCVLLAPLSKIPALQMKHIEHLGHIGEMTKRNGTTDDKKNAHKVQWGSEEEVKAVDTPC